jgi:threonine/homoserine/homoserine lactone efflux protein
MTWPGAVVAFAIVATPLIVAPGPSVLFVVGRALALGRRAAIATAVGNAVGIYVAVVVVSVGVGAIVSASDVAFTVLKLAGAAYLLVLGVRTLLVLRDTAVTGTSEYPAHARGDRRALRDGFVVGVTNPKAIVFFAAVLPQFVDRDLGWIPLQMLLLGLVFVVIAMASDSAWAIAAASAGSRLGRNGRPIVLLRAVGAIVMIVLAVVLALVDRGT